MIYHMPYYYVSKRKPRNKKSRRLKIIAALLVVILLLAGLFIIVSNNAAKIIEQMTSAQIRKIINDKINESLDALVSNKNVDYDDYMQIKYDQGGNVTLISADMFMINTLMSTYSTLIQKNIRSIDEYGISVPALALSGWPLIANLGTKVKLKIQGIGSAPCNYHSEFKEMGINQTLHSIYIDVVASVDIVLPVKNITVTESSSVLVCENLIVGKVPDFYLNGLK